MIAALAFVALTLIAMAPQADAQPLNSPLARPGEATPPRHPQRITIYPGRPLYRRCVDWYELQNRPSGPVLFPQMHCWWVRG